MNKDEREWIHPRALAVLDETFRHECLAGRNYKEIKPSSSLPNAHCLAKCGIAGLCEAESKWDDAGCPLLSDKARTVLEVVEEILKGCKPGVCGKVNKVCDPWIRGEREKPPDCPYQNIRRAWKGKKP